MANHSDVFRGLVRNVADGRLDPAEALEFVTDDGFGGFNMFVGRVRRQSHGRLVTGIQYDMFYIAHAKGQLGIGDPAVVIAVGSPHRDEAFRACRDVIEAVKHRAPIWKREHFIDGSSEWSEGCSLCGQDSAPPSAPDGQGPEATGR
jgi:molybdopterin synthase catalytic subunit